MDAALGATIEGKERSALKCPFSNRCRKVGGTDAGRWLAFARWRSPQQVREGGHQSPL